MNIIDEHNRTPNVFHFHGQNINELPQTFSNILNNYVVDADYDRNRLAIVSTWTDDEKCCLLQQFKKFGIPLINCVPDTYNRNQSWYMPNKIRFFLNTIKQLEHEYIMFLDGYDVLISGLSNVIERFESQKYRILFGPSCNNYPDVKIDHLYGRSKLGVYRYFNAGCCMGRREDLISFYEQALDFINIDNPLTSEQFVLRHVFARYSDDPEQNFVNIDSESLIFRSMGVTNSTMQNGDIYLVPNREVRPHYVYLGVEGQNTKTDLFFSTRQVNCISNLFGFIDECIRSDDQLDTIFYYNITNNQKNKLIDICKKRGVHYKELKKEQV